MGQPILQIPKTHPTEILSVEFSLLERWGYAELQEALRKRAAESNRSGKASKGIRMQDLSRLRFYISHPALVDPGYPGEGAAEIQGWGLEEAAANTRQYFCRLCRNVLAGPLVPNVRPSKPSRYVWMKLANISQCGHAFCWNCYAEERPGKCPSCATSITDMRRPNSDECFDNERRTSQQLAEPNRRKNKPRRPGDDEFGVQPRMGRPALHKKRNGRRFGENTKKLQKPKKNKRGGKASQKPSAKKMTGKRSETHVNVGKFLAACDSQPWNPVPHSTKTKAALDLVRKWQAEAPDDKIISMHSFPEAPKWVGGTPN